MRRYNPDSLPKVSEENDWRSQQPMGSQDHTGQLYSSSRTERGRGPKFTVSRPPAGDKDSSTRDQVRGPSSRGSGTEGPTWGSLLFGSQKCSGVRDPWFCTSDLWDSLQKITQSWDRVSK